MIMGTGSMPLRKKFGGERVHAQCIAKHVCFLQINDGRTGIRRMKFVLRLCRDGCERQSQASPGQGEGHRERMGKEILHHSLAILKGSAHTHDHTVHLGVEKAGSLPPRGAGATTRCIRYIIVLCSRIGRIIIRS